MDENQFDSLTAAIGTAPSRLGVFRALLGGVLAMAGADLSVLTLWAPNATNGETATRSEPECGF